MVASGEEPSETNQMERLVEPCWTLTSIKSMFVQMMISTMVNIWEISVCNFQVRDGVPLDGDAVKLVHSDG